MLVKYQEDIATVLFEIFGRDSIEPVEMEMRGNNKVFYRCINGKVVKMP
jgi:hypothetical protein